MEIILDGNVKSPEMVIPVLEFDGINRPQLTLLGSGFNAVMQGKTLKCTSNGKDTYIKDSAVNRTGIYKLLKIPFNGKSLKLEMSVADDF